MMGIGDWGVGGWGGVGGGGGANPHPQKHDPKTQTPQKKIKFL